MPRSLRISSQSIGFQLRFLCFCREEGIIKARRNGIVYKSIIIMCITMIVYLQYTHNIMGCQNGRRRIVPYLMRLITKTSHNNSEMYGAPEDPIYYSNTPVCRLNKSALGPIKLNKTMHPYMKLMEKSVKNVKSGGFHSPAHCRPRHKVAVLIPYRSRPYNLMVLMYYLHPLMQKQLLYYRIFLIEQYGKGKFNKGSLFNAGFLESQRFGKWHCVIFHDVDLIPQDERILYSCPRNPTHMSPAVDNMHNKWYRELFGGVTSMTTQQFLRVNGYSNDFWNWGAEDDDMYIRIQASRLPMLRYNASIARYAAMPHKLSMRNRARYSTLKSSKRRFRQEGLRSLEYKLISITKRKLYTHILIDVNPFRYQY